MRKEVEAWMQVWFVAANDARACHKRPQPRECPRQLRHSGELSVLYHLWHGDATVYSSCARKKKHICIPGLAMKQLISLVSLLTVLYMYPHIINIWCI